MNAHPDQWREAAIAAVSGTTNGVCARAWVTQRNYVDARFTSESPANRVRSERVDASFTVVARTMR